MKFLALFLFLFAGNSYAVGYVNIGYPLGTFFYDNQLYINAKNGVIKISPDIQNKVPSQREIAIPSKAGRIPVTLEQKTPINIAKLGSAAKKLGKTLPLIGTGLVAFEIICELSDICENDVHTALEKRTPLTEEELEANPTTTGIFYYQRQYYNDDPHLPSPSSVCTYVDSIESSPSYEKLTYNSSVGGSYGGCELRYKGETTVIQVKPIQRRVGCPDGYTQDGLICNNNNGTKDYRTAPVTDTDWDNADAPLSSPALITPLIDADQPLPATDPQTTPKTVETGKETTTVRNGEGTATGTRTTTTTTQIDPVAGQPNIVKLTDITTITNTDNTTNITNTTTTINEPPDVPPEEEKDEEVEFDTVDDEDLPEHEIPSQFEHQSFGGGSCPANPVVSTSKGSLTMPFDRACNFATTVKPIIIVLAFLVAGFIISGTKQND